jgi:hypothetical protein
VPIEWPDRLPIPAALRFLEQAHQAGVEVLGFTGGEPFLYFEFVETLTRRAAELGYRFDKVMTNGVWYQDEAHLTDTLTRLRDAGFTGKIGLSIDKFHGRHLEQVVTFCQVTRRVFDRDTILSLSYASHSPTAGLAPVRELAERLDAVVEWSDWLQRYLLVGPEYTMTLNWNHLAPVERAEKLPRSAWDGAWFAEDYCEGPGQALIVTPRGEVKPCCGFASDLDQLTIGNLHTDSAEQVIAQGRNHPYVGKVFRAGLLAIRDDILAHDPTAFPQATTNQCYFCWYILTKNLVALPASVPGTPPPGRVQLPLVGERPVANATAVLMAFDGQTVFLGRELTPEMPTETGRVYLVTIAGPGPVELPAPRLAWSAYQAWIDQVRAAGFTLTTQQLTACRK